VPAAARDVRIREYSTATLPSICHEAPDNGITFLLLPAGSAVHIAYAQDAPGYEQQYLKPVAGWVTGVHVSQIGKQTPKVFNGLSGEMSPDLALAMHVGLPAGKFASIDIMNVFRPGDGEEISFPSSGFSARECVVGGERISFGEYLKRVQPDPHVPLIADYNGSLVNVSLQGMDEQTGAMRFYAPVFEGVKYRFAAPVGDYSAAFNAAMPNGNVPVTFACNCILNYLYAGLEGKRTGATTGPMTFGEIAHQLLNQTLVRVTVQDAA
jgi:hypothetical protein